MSESKQNTTQQSEQKSKQTIATFAFFLISFLGFLAMALWLWFGNIEESVSGMGQLIPEGKLRQVMSPINGAITHVYVRENQEVSKGQLLMDLDPEPTEAEGNSFASQLAYLQNEANILQAASSGNKTVSSSSATQNAWLNASQLSYTAQVSALKMQITKTIHLHQQAEERKKKLAGLLAISENTLERYKTLNKAGGITEVELGEYEQKTIDTRGELAAVQEEIKAKEIELMQAEEQLKQAKGDYQKEILLRLTDHERNILNLQGEIKKNQVTRKRQSIYAPMDGIINEQIFHGIGEVVTSGQSLMSIVPKGTKLIAEVKVANKDLSYIYANQRVTLMIDAFPYQKFGRLHGKVIAISPSTITPQAQDRDPTPHYVVRIKSEKDFMQDGKTIIPLKAGMTLTADIITRDKNVLSFFTEPLNFSFDRAFRNPSSRSEKL